MASRADLAFATSWPDGATAALLATQLGLIAALQLAGYTTEWVLQFQLLMLALTKTNDVNEIRRMFREY